MREIKVGTLDYLEGIKNIDDERFNDSSYKEDIFIAALSSSSSKILVALEDNKVIGFLLFTIEEDAVDIDHIAVKKECEGKGIATSLLSYLEKYLLATCINKIFLEVRKSNDKAIRLYEKNKFEFYRTRKKYYKNGEDALCYVKEISK